MESVYMIQCGAKHKMCFDSISYFKNMHGGMNMGIFLLLFSIFQIFYRENAFLIFILRRNIFKDFIFLAKKSALVFFNSMSHTHLGHLLCATSGR